MTNGISTSEHLSPAVRSFLAEEVLRVSGEQTRPLYDLQCTWIARVETQMRLEDNEFQAARAHRLAQRKFSRDQEARVAQIEANAATRHAEVMTALASMGAVDADLNARVTEAHKAATEARNLAADAHERAEVSTQHDLAELARFRAHSGDFLLEAAQAKLAQDVADGRLKRESKRTRSKTAWKIVGALAVAIFTVGAAVGTTLAAQNCGAHHSSESK